MNIEEFNQRLAHIDANRCLAREILKNCQLQEMNLLIDARIVGNSEKGFRILGFDKVFATPREALLHNEQEDHQGRS